MLGLAIHTCGPDLGLALSNSDGEVRYQTWALGRDLSTRLHSLLIEFVAPHAWADFSLLAVAQGPGGFTGTRMGVVTARTLAQQLEIPLFGVSTLAAIARRSLVASSQGATKDIAVEMQARREQIYTAIYRPSAGGLAVIQPDQARSLDDWETVFKDYPHPLTRVTATDDLAETVVQVLELAYGRWQRGDRPLWSTVMPYYGQHPVDR
ncbi:MAG: tRNA (adenosine(37)-N6)-threonylcarbamoyltransferase complex dimerization subunit type 1 TsaB [Nodosilinea sp.]